ncbi:MAG: hypothetical protein PCFJNLEI_04070 [Verrucomicrobiae bacterium]|nr:hypothetical protein [Verrucomicrobiae bacterium]
MTDDELKNALRSLAQQGARTRRLEVVIVDAIRVLEETKSSFKSRKLGALRER